MELLDTKLAATQAASLRFRTHPLSLQEQSDLLSYARTLARWNQAYNLVGPAVLEDLYPRHFPEALALFPCFAPQERILDIGTGAGFPGLLLAIYGRENLKVTLLDAAEKKCRFLREMVHQLALPQVTVISSRAESFAQHQPEAFSVVVMRAVAEVKICLRLAAPLLADQGQLLLLKGNGYADELQRLTPVTKALFSPPELLEPAGWREGGILRFKKVPRETQGET